MTRTKARLEFRHGTWLKGASAALALSMMVAGTARAEGNAQLRRHRRSTASGCARHHGRADLERHPTHPRDPLHVQFRVRHRAAAGGRRNHQRRRQSGRDHAPSRREIPQWRRDDGRRRGRILEPLGRPWRSRQGPLRSRRERRGDRRLRGHDHVQGRLRSLEEPSGLQQWRSYDLSGGDRRRCRRRADCE